MELNHRKSIVPSLVHAKASPTSVRVWRWPRSVGLYARVLNPRETLLLSFIGLCSGTIAARGLPPLGRLLLAWLVVTVGSAGTNGLTNCLDRHVDARMHRTRQRVLPAGLLQPERALALSALLVIGALGLAYYLHPYAFMAGAVGVAAAIVGRKTWATHFMGALSSTGPVLVAWLAVNPHVDAVVVLLTLIVLMWVPVHVWNLMIAYKEDYLEVGVNIFPLDRSVRLTTYVSLALSVSMYVASLAVWAVGDFGWLYFAIANIIGLPLVAAGVLMVRGAGRRWAYRVFKLTAFPFLGLTYLGLAVDVLARGA